MLVLHKPPRLPPAASCAAPGSPCCSQVSRSRCREAPWPLAPLPAGGRARTSRPECPHTCASLLLWPPLQPPCRLRPCRLLQALWPQLQPPRRPQRCYGCLHPVAQRAVLMLTAAAEESRAIRRSNFRAVQAPWCQRLHWRWAAAGGGGRRRHSAKRRQPLAPWTCLLCTAMPCPTC